MIALRGLGRRITGFIGALVAWGLGRESLASAVPASPASLTVTEALLCSVTLLDAIRNTAAIALAPANPLTLTEALRNTITPSDASAYQLTVTDAVL
mgnify:CR=1 FL=1